MTEPTRSLHIITIDAIAGKYLEEMLSELLGNEVKITRSLLNFDNFLDCDPDVVLTSGDFLFETAKSIYRKSHIVYAKREIARKNLDKLLQLPRNKKVLVVNHPLKASESTIESLNRLGFNHLEYIPYQKGMGINFNEIDTAISPNMMHICPEGITNRINIGSRTISFSTLLEIVEILELDKSYLDMYLYQINRDIIEVSFNIFEQKLKSEHLKNNLYMILNTLIDSIVTLDVYGNITYVNEAFCKLAGVDKVEIIGVNIDKVINNIKDYSKIENIIQNNESDIISIFGKKVFVKYLKLQDNTDKEGMIIIREVNEVQKMEEDIRNILSRKGHVAKYSFTDIKGDSFEIKSVIKTAKKIANNDLTITITGETGTGKEVFAQAIHNYSPRKDRAFVAVNLASLPESLIESELFGYAEGAFTGSKKGGKPGLFEQAHKGTIFIDEIGEVSKNIQTRLLRVLEEKEIMRIGDNRITKIDVRIITATNKDLKNEVDKGNFREDLYYRLNVLSLQLPPLRDRTDDICTLLQYYLGKKRFDVTFKDDAYSALLNYGWPGNVRELVNVVEFISQTVETNIVDIQDLPTYIINNQSKNKKYSVSKSIYQRIPYDKLIVDFIIQTIYDYQINNLRIGRKKIFEIGLNSGIEDISEDKIRNILKHLQREEMVRIGIKGEGTSLTEMGIKFIKLI